MSAMIVQRRPEGLAEGEYRDGFPEYDGRLKSIEIKIYQLIEISNQPSAWRLVPFWRGKLV